MKVVMRSQEQLLYVCFCVLLNLAHDEHIRRKMIKRGIVKYLGEPPTPNAFALVPAGWWRLTGRDTGVPTVPLLDRENPKLLLLVTNFLRCVDT